MFPAKQELQKYPLNYWKIGAIVNSYDTVKYGEYTAFWTPIPREVNGFVFLRRNEPNQYQQKSPLLKTRSNGYKIHISIYDSSDDSSNLILAWDILARNILQHNVYQVKIIAPDFRKLLRQDDEQRGKEITIYSFKEERPTEAWLLFFYDVTREFVANSVIPGALPSGDLSITGSNYFSYRNDSPNFSIINPFSSIDLTHIPEQLSRNLTEGRIEDVRQIREFIP